MRILTAVIFAGIAAALTSCGTLSLTDVKNFEGVQEYNLGDDVNTSYSDYCGDLHNDRLIFTSNRPTVEGYIQGEDFWFTDRQGKSWTRALNLGASINTQRDEGSPNVVSGGDEIFFVIRNSEDGFGDEDIYQAELDYNGKWQKVRNLGEGINTSYWDSHPYLSPDGEELYFVSDRPGGYGGTDLYVAKRTRSGRWGAAKNLGPEVNSSGDESSPMVAPDNETLFFASTGHPGLGGYDIFVSKKEQKKNKWSKPVNAGTPINTRKNDQFFRLSAMEDTIFISSDRSGGNGELDIWALAPNPYKDTSRYTFYVSGMVFDTTTQYPIRNATVKIEPQNGKPFTLQLENGKYRFRTKLNSTYTMTGSAKDYTTQTVTFTVPSTLYYNEYRKNIGLAAIPTSPVERDSAKALERRGVVVYFTFDKSDIVSMEAGKINEVFVQQIKPLLDKGQQFEVVLNAYTCDLGTEQYNIGLSRRRGAAVSRAFKDLGTPVDAIVVNADGEVPPHPDMSEEERTRNRRVEIVVIPSVPQKE